MSLAYYYHYLLPTTTYYLLPTTTYYLLLPTTTYYLLPTTDDDYDYDGSLSRQFRGSGPHEWLSHSLLTLLTYHVGWGLLIRSCHYPTSISLPWVRARAPCWLPAARDLGARADPGQLQGHCQVYPELRGSRVGKLKWDNWQQNCSYPGSV